MLANECKHWFLQDVLNKITILGGPKALQNKLKSLRRAALSKLIHKRRKQVWKKVVLLLLVSEKHENAQNSRILQCSKRKRENLVPPKPLYFGGQSAYFSNRNGLSKISAQNGCLEGRPGDIKSSCKAFSWLVAESIIFRGCLARNHYFYSSQGCRKRLKIIKNWFKKKMALEAAGNPRLARAWAAGSTQKTKRKSG